MRMRIFPKKYTNYISIAFYFDHLFAENFAPKNCSESRFYIHIIFSTKMSLGVHFILLSEYFWRAISNSVISAKTQPVRPVCLCRVSDLLLSFDFYFVKKAQIAIISVIELTWSQWIVWIGQESWTKWLISRLSRKDVCRYELLFRE